jgi:hypothetical protein
VKTNKDKKSKGHKTARLLIPKKIAVAECLDKTEYWDDWSDNRDGMRDWRDRSHLYARKMRFSCWRAKMAEAKNDHEKIKKLLSVRKAKKVIRR